MMMSTNNDSPGAYLLLCKTDARFVAVGFDEDFILSLSWPALFADGIFSLFDSLLLAEFFLLKPWKNQQAPWG